MKKNHRAKKVSFLLLSSALLLSTGGSLLAQNPVFAAQTTTETSAKASKSITGISLSGLELPGTGNRPVQAASVRTEKGYTVANLRWFEGYQNAQAFNKPTFASGKVYVAKITLNAEPGYKFDAMSQIQNKFTYDLGAPTVVKTAFSFKDADKIQIVPDLSYESTLTFWAYFPKTGSAFATQPKRLDTPQNVRIENGFLKWDAVDKAERYQITVQLCNENGVGVKLWKVDSDHLTTTQESAQEIKDFLNEDYGDLPTGNYKFSVKASTLHNGIWNGTYASENSAYTAVVALD